MEHSSFIQFIGEYWQVVFLYVFKYLSEMRKEYKETHKDLYKKYHDHDFDIKMLQWQNGTLKGHNHVTPQKKE